MRIDAFAHALPPGYPEAVQAALGRTLPLWERCETLTNLDLRLEMLDECGIDVQVVSTPPPPVDCLFGTERASELARVANEGMAELVSRSPKRLRGVATVSLLDPNGAAAEARRCVEDLGLCGVLVYSNVAGRPLDADGLQPFYAALEALDVPMWLHPYRSTDVPDYAGEERSRYQLARVFGWSYDTTLAMGRLVFGGVFRRHPRLNVIVHHAGGMVPFLAQRIRKQYGEGTRAADAEPDGGEAPGLEQFRRFHVDTVTAGSISALMNAYELFGAARMVFASDMPFGKGMGREYLRDAILSVEHLPIPAAEKERIWSGTLRTVCDLKL